MPAVLVVLGAAVGPGAWSPAAAAGDYRTPLHQSLHTRTGSLSTVEIAVPPGTTGPFSVLGTLRADRVAPGSLSLVVDGETISAKPVERSRVVNVPVPLEAVADGIVEVGIRYDPPADSDVCSPEVLTASLSDLSLLHDGQETPAETVTAFLASQVPRVDVVVAPEADASLLGAALAATTALSSRYPGTPVGLLGSAEPVPDGGDGARIVELRTGFGAVRTSLDVVDGVQRLTLVGGSEELVAAARALGSDQVDLADATATSGLSPQMVSAEVGATQVLADLVTQPLELGDPGRSEAGFTVRQDSFGGPVGSLSLHLVGNHTALPSGADARLDAYAGDRLVGSTRLEHGTDVVLDAEISGRALHPVDDLRLELSGAGDESPCLGADTHHPLRLSIDTAASTLSATPAAGEADLSSYPQVLDGALDVALRPTGASLLAVAKVAAQALGALQQAAARPLEVTLVDPDDLIDGDHSGLLVGADHQDGVAAGTPMRRTGGGQVTTAYAALQSVEDHGRHLLVLDARAPSQQASLAGLRHAGAYLGSAGWSGLTGAVLVLPRGGGPVSLATAPERAPTGVGHTAGPPTTASAEAVAPKGGRSAWWLVLVAATVAVLGARLGGVRRERSAATDGGPRVASRAGSGGPGPRAPRASTGGADRGHLRRPGTPQRARRRPPRP